MNHNKTIFYLSIALALSAGANAQTNANSAECRGVAAGVVAAMRASGEIESQSVAAVAVTAARRACDAARGEELSAAVQAPEAAAAAAAPAATSDNDEPSLWDLLTQEKDRKPGNDRLRRLKQ